MGQVSLSKSFSSEILPMSPFEWGGIALAALFVYLLSAVGVIAPLTNTIDALSSPSKSAIMAQERAITRLFDTFRELPLIVTENNRLNERIVELEGELANVELIFVENERLIRETGISYDRDYPQTGAQIIGFRGGDVTSVVINKGESDGIEVGDIAVIGNTLLGKVVEIAPASSRVQLITNSNSTIPVKTAEQSIGLLSGAGGNTLVLEQILRTSEVEEGQRLYTSGINSDYPPDLFIGTISGLNVDDRDSTQSAQVSPAVNYARVTNIKILSMPGQ